MPVDELVVESGVVLSMSMIVVFNFEVYVVGDLFIYSCVR
jgi:hypothetical protein